MHFLVSYFNDFHFPSDWKLSLWFVNGNNDDVNNWISASSYFENYFLMLSSIVVLTFLSINLSSFFSQCWIFFSQIVLTDCRRTLFNLVLVILLFSNGVSHRWFLLSCTHTNQDILKMEITYSISPVRNKIRVCCEASGQYVLIGLINWNRFSLCDI